MIRLIERNTGEEEVWVGKSETQYGKYEISGILKVIGFIIIICVSFWVGSIM